MGRRKDKIRIKILKPEIFVGASSFKPASLPGKTQKSVGDKDDKKDSKGSKVPN